MKKNRYNEILEAATELFAKKGYAVTSMREISENLEITKATLYHYFKSKEQILFEILNNVMDEALESLEKISKMRIPPEEKLKNVLKFYSKYYVSKQNDLILLVNELNSLSENFRKILINKEKIYLNLMKLIFNELKMQGKLRDIPLTVLAFSFFGMVHYTIKWYHPDGSIKPEELSEYFVEIFTKGILNTSF
jgi:AcrR family transcriptional regulator